MNANQIAEEALKEIAFAGMSPSPEMSEDGIAAWHARQAWRFIGIAARALEESSRAAIKAKAVQVEPNFNDIKKLGGIAESSDPDECEFYFQKYVKNLAGAPMTPRHGRMGHHDAPEERRRSAVAVHGRTAGRVT